MEDKRIYVVVLATVEVNRRKVVQPPGRQIAQACHVVSKLRLGDMRMQEEGFEPITTIILQARDSAEERHVWALLVKKKLNPTYFEDTNQDAYGPGPVITALAVLATPYQVQGILDYLPLWGAQ